MYKCLRVQSKCCNKRNVVEQESSITQFLATYVCSAVDIEQLT